MNARRRERPDGLPSRVYIKAGSYYWVRPDNKWLKLCRVDEGDRRMLERLAEEKRRMEPALGIGNMPRLVAAYMDERATQYADSYREEWKRRGEDVRKYFRDWDVHQVDTAAVADFLVTNWGDKLPTQRAMKGWLSKFFGWAMLRRHAQANPCREVSVKKPKVRTVYIPDRDFLAIYDALLVTRPHPTTGRQAKVPTGDMMQCFVDLCYLTCQRSTEIRLLRWDQIDRDAGVIHFLPTKTEDSSGEAVDWPLTSEIEAVLSRAKALAPVFGQVYVIRDKHGAAKTDQACRDAWEGAMARANLADKPYTVKDIRAKALTDAKRAGYTLDDLQVAGAHTDRATTAGYIKSRETPQSIVRLSLPSKKSA